MLVTGSVLTNDYGILPNVTVEAVGEYKNTTTDESGRFSINVASPASQLKFSHVGFDYDTVSITQFQQDGNLMLLFPASNELPEVIIHNNGKPKSSNSGLIIGLIALLGIGALALSGKKSTKVKA